MKATIRDIDTLRSIRPLELLSYLRAHHWFQASQIENGAFWAKELEGESFEVLLPLDANLRDYPNRIAEVLQTLELSEGRSQLEILEDLLTTNADLVRPRLPGPNHAGEISLEQGRIVYEQARNLMLAAACAAVERRSVYARRKPEQAMRFLDHARFGMPQRGSYILTIISPVSPRIAQRPDPIEDDLVDEPFERRTMRTLAEAVHALELASREVAATGRIEPMQRAVQAGVSANLCEAIIGLHEGSGERGIEFNFSWAPLRLPPPGVPRFASITPDVIPIIRETARIFRETETTAGIELTGLVRRLDHQGGDRGRAVLATTVEGLPRNVTVDLSGVDHGLAVRSYEDRIPLSCVGELRREGRAWLLENPRELQLIPSDGAGSD